MDRLDGIDEQILAELAVKDEAAFAALVEKAKAAHAQA